MGVSINGGTPQSSISIGCSITTIYNLSILGYPHDYGNHQIRGAIQISTAETSSELHSSNGCAFLQPPSIIFVHVGAIGA